MQLAPSRAALPAARERLAPALQAAGFDGRTPTIVVWEGVINYLDDRAARATLNELGGLVCPGSVLVADYVEMSGFDAGFRGRTEAVANTLERGGEPLRSGIRDIANALETARFTILDDEAIELLPKRYGATEHPRHYPARILTAAKQR